MLLECGGSRSKSCCVLLDVVHTNDIIDTASILLNVLEEIKTKLIRRDKIKKKKNVVSLYDTTNEDDSSVGYICMSIGRMNEHDTTKGF